MSIPEYPDPVALFREWLAEAERVETSNPNAMALASVGADGVPSIRTVLLKDVGDDGSIVFYTNTASRKGRDLGVNPAAAACFYWRPLERQVRFEGETTRVGEGEADAYFASRPRGSQIGAWASEQSEVLASRTALERQVAAVESRFAGVEVPRPPHWTGYRLRARHIEFWLAETSRLHYRLAYDRDGDGWRRRWLNP
jgi:pyridoxamine 5'-phosphate oxidase